MPGVALLEQERRGAELGERLDHQHARQRWAARKVAGEEGLVVTKAPDTRRSLARDDRRHLGDKRKGGRCGMHECWIERSGERRRQHDPARQGGPARIGRNLPTASVLGPPVSRRRPRVQRW